MGFDVVIRGGTVVDGTGAPTRRADVGINVDRVTAIQDRIDESAGRTLAATGRLVTPGFVDIHTHLDAQIAWDPMGTSSCWHGVTSVVLGNCGVTFAPVAEGGRETLAEMMESVEDIPRDAILNGLPWDWTSYGGYLDWVDRIPKGLNVGGMVGHCAVRLAAMGDRSLAETPATGDDIDAMCAHVDEAMRSGALGFSTSRTLLHRVPDGRPVPGTFATTDELYAIGDVLGRHGPAVVESASRLGERDSEELPNTRAEVAWMGEVSRRSGRPVSFGLAQSFSRPDLYSRVITFTKEENERGASVRPQTTARAIGILLGIANRTPFDRGPTWRALHELPLSERLDALRDPTQRAVLVAEAEAATPILDAAMLFVLPDGAPRYDMRPEDSLTAHAARRGVSAVEAFIDLSLETEGRLTLTYPFLNQSLDAVAEMLTDPLVTLGLADAGAHVGQIMDASQPTLFLSYWIRDHGLLPIEEAVRRLTSDTAELFGIRDRGVLAPGAYADVNVIDLEGLALASPMYVHDFPGGAGRYVQGGRGYDYTLVNGQVFMNHGEHAGVFAGRTLRSTD